MLKKPCLTPKKAFSISPIFSVKKEGRKEKDHFVFPVLIIEYMCNIPRVIWRQQGWKSSIEENDTSRLDKSFCFGMHQFGVPWGIDIFDSIQKKTIWSVINPVFYGSFGTSIDREPLVLSVFYTVWSLGSVLRIVWGDPMISFLSSRSPLLEQSSSMLLRIIASSLVRFRRASLLDVSWALWHTYLSSNEVYSMVGSGLEMVH